jgi:hypothetical protein
MKKLTGSKLIAYCLTSLDIIATLVTLALCRMAVLRGYTGSLPYLTALIGALQAETAVVLSGYYKKSGVENSKGGIVYDAAMKNDTGRTI